MKNSNAHTSNILHQFSVEKTTKARRKVGKTSRLQKPAKDTPSKVGQEWSQSSEAWRLIIEKWKQSNHLEPTHMLTLNFCRPVLDEHLEIKGNTISSFKTRYFDQLRRIYKRNGLLLLAAWVIEVKNLPHIHILIRVPTRRVRLQIIRWLDRSFPHDVEKTGKKRGRNSGAPAVLTKLSERKVYRKTGRRGLEGMEDYLAKAIDKNSLRKKGRNIGRIYGQTNDLAGPGLFLIAESRGRRHD